MAKNPYTQDVTKSTAYRQVTGQDKDKLSQVLEGAVVLKTAYNNNVASNIEALQDSKVIEIQKKKLMLKSLNGVSLIQNFIFVLTSYLPVCSRLVKQKSKRN